MAGADRTATDTVDLIRSLSERPYAFGLFSTIRRLECLYGHQPRIGKAIKTNDESLRFSQEPSLAFAPSELAAFDPPKGGQPARLTNRFFGLFGPNGPLPHHLTEYARDRLRNARDPTFSRFVDIFHNRLVALFYRAWADKEPTVNFDRPADDAFARHVGAFLGIGLPSLRNRDALHDYAKLFYAGRLSSLPRHPEGLQSMLSEFFHTPAALEEFVGEWMQLDSVDRWRLGTSASGKVLGKSAVLGERVWSRQSKFRVTLGPMSLADYRQFLPDGGRLQRMTALVGSYVGHELNWDVRLKLRKDQVPAFRLGRTGQLGWTTWLDRRAHPAHADDLVLATSALTRPASAAPAAAPTQTLRRMA